jgi:hypothetical protein
MSLSNMMDQPRLWSYCARVRQLHEVSVAFVREIRGKAGTPQLLNLGSAALAGLRGEIELAALEGGGSTARVPQCLWREAITVITSAAEQPRASGWTRRETL